ncbi:MAG TPA: hypothetical protein VNA16_08395, partial [Abditibacteriaceae bacterium]|nr:hypothetical protein [Abditibacteriaceae bacterium]
LDEMMAEELQFADTHVSAICHGTDISGLAQYMTKLPGHRYPAERVAEEEFIAAEYYPWGVQQLLKYEAAGRCPLDDSIAAAHKIGRKLYAYHRMGITRLYAPMRMFENPMYDAHPEWRCVDFDGTPISRLSICYPEVRQYFLDHFRETVERGADGVCLVFARGWPMLLFEPPVAQEFEHRTGRIMRTVAPDDPDLLAVRTDFFNEFMREIRETVTSAAQGRAVEVVALTLATPEINRSFGMDCARWAREGWVDVLIPYPYGSTAQPTAINVPAWMPVIAGANAKLCPILNRMTYEPSGIHESPHQLLQRAEKWLDEGAHGLAVWDLDSKLASPTYRRLAYNIASTEGRARLREIFAAGTVRHCLKTLDGLAVDRYHPGWNV